MTLLDIVKGIFFLLALAFIIQDIMWKRRWNKEVSEIKRKIRERQEKYDKR